jgi:histidinol-phosphatase (PHP family)
MLFDSHVHSYASPDSQMDPCEAISILRGKNMGVIFTEHVDYVTYKEQADKTATDFPKYQRDFLADFLIYPQRYEKYRAKDVLLGLEVGLTKAYANLNKKTVEEYNYDFVLGSIHFVDGFDIYKDYCSSPQFEDHYGRMLTYTAEMIRVSGFFDSLAHIDYVSRVSPFPEKNVLYEAYPEEYDVIFRLLAERELAMEINTARLSDKAAFGNLQRLFSRFRELGGRYVTVGSDAHQASDLARNFNLAKQIWNDAGLTPVYYRERKKYKYEPA